MNALRRSIRPVSRAVLPTVQKRSMAGGAAPQWTGIDKVVRDVFPEDYQVALLIMGGYGVIITGFMLKPSKPAAPAPVAPVAVKTTSTSIPSVDDEAFASFIEDESNLQKWIDTAE
mmetsp:Transcript_14952/g.18234  ORF Transcript_14952/g.18234 Transcript_14952/m.18234 type:complete len:116 (-) Transcript_14952:299-646(-)